MIYHHYSSFSFQLSLALSDVQSDPITYPLLRRLQGVMGYNGEEHMTLGC